PHPPPPGARPAPPARPGARRPAPPPARSPNLPPSPGRSCRPACPSLRPRGVWKSGSVELRGIRTPVLPHFHTPRSGSIHLGGAPDLNGLPSMVIVSLITSSRFSFQPPAPFTQVWRAVARSSILWVLPSWPAVRPAKRMVTLAVASLPFTVTEFTLTLTAV